MPRASPWDNGCPQRHLLVTLGTAPQVLGRAGASQGLNPNLSHFLPISARCASKGTSFSSASSDQIVTSRSSQVKGDGPPGSGHVADAFLRAPMAERGRVRALFILLTLQLPPHILSPHQGSGSFPAHSVLCATSEQQTSPSWLRTPCLYLPLCTLCHKASPPFPR